MGYSLIEVLVAIAIFSVAVAIATSSFVSSLGSQNRALSVRETIDNASHVMEYISRALRMAKKDLNASCIATAGSNYENPGPGESEVRFLSYDSNEGRYICREFYLSGDNRLKERKSDDETPFFTTDLDLTSSDLKVEAVKFKLLGEEQSGDQDQQPRVTLLLEMTRDDVSKIIIQTTTSQRNLDIMQ